MSVPFGHSPDEIVQACAGNTSFSPALPGLQLAVDATSLEEFKVCPRRYFYAIVMGYESVAENVHITFGLLLHSAVEAYHRDRCQGLGHEQAVERVMYETLRATWNSRLQRPWLSDDKNKNRLTLCQTVLGYLDDVAQNDPLETLIRADGSPAIEEHFVFDSGFVPYGGENWLFCGWLDRRVQFAGAPRITDIKTTKYTLDPDWFKQFTPHNQFSMYSLAGREVFQTPVKTLIVDGVQILQGGSRFQRGEVPRDDAMISEWHAEQEHWLKEMEICATDGRYDGERAWPMNETSCVKYGGCRFREVCTRSPVQRRGALQATFRRRVWDPLTGRKDI